MCISVVRPKNPITVFPPPRPYTAYNIFFQLEREYILQNIFHVTPSLDFDEVFDNDDEEYTGPPLPSRYWGLILPRDWHVPGKGRRNKRSHRATHRKIGFNELSQLIAKGWSAADYETRKFCTQVSNRCKSEYKAAVSEISMSNVKPEENKVSKTSKSCELKTAEKAKVSSQESPLLSVDRVISNSDISMDAAGEALSPNQEVREALDSSVIDTLFTSFSSVTQNHKALVDVEDKKIIEIWHSIPVD